MDDEPNNLQLLGQILQDRYQLAFTTDGSKTLEVARKIHPDLILLDIMMPGMDGYNVCRQLKAQAEIRKVPEIFVTAMGAVVDKVKGFELGAVDYITKPIEPEEVLARVHTHLTIQGLQSELFQKNQKLLQLLEKEQELNRLKSQFVSMVSREFKTPLTAIALSCNLIKPRNGIRSYQ